MNPLPEFRFLNDKCEELEEKLKIAVEALEFYADYAIYGDAAIKALEQIKKG